MPSHISIPDIPASPMKEEVTGDNLQTGNQPHPVEDSPTANQNSDPSTGNLVLEISASDEQGWKLVSETARHSGAVSARVVLTF